MPFDLGFSDDIRKPLLWAIDNRNDTALDHALAVPVDLNEPGNEGVTLLIYTLSKRYLYGVRRLIEAGANPNYIGPKGDSAVTLSAGADDPRLLSTVLAGGGDPNLKDGCGEPSTFVAARQRRWENVEALLDAGAHLEARDVNDETLLLTLALRREFEQAVALLERGADPSAQNRIGVTLAHRLQLPQLIRDAERETWRQTLIEMLHEVGVPVPPNRD